MPLQIVVPTYVLRNGEHAASGQAYWRSLLAGQLAEAEATFGQLHDLAGDEDVVNGIDLLEAPAVLVVPAMSGGRVAKEWKGWSEFRGALARFRRRGGVVAVYEAAFNLPAEGQRAKGRHWQGMERDPGMPYRTGSVTVTRAPLQGGENATVAALATPWRLWSEWRIRQASSDGRAAEVAWVTSTEGRLALAWAWQRRAADEPGAMLFLNSWSWVHHARARGTAYAVDPANAASLDAIFGVYRDMNRQVVLDALENSVRRSRERTRRLEIISADSVRLPHRTGKEKDYHRLLLNDEQLCIDLVGWRGLGREREPSDASRFLNVFRDAEVWNEPGHDKGGGGTGRLDILLVSKDDAAATEEGKSVLSAKTRAPVAWIELEAGGFNARQIGDFISGHGNSLRQGDFVVSVDRSSDSHTALVEAAALVRSRGATFLHVQIPEAFERLDEYYAPELHRMARKRFTLDIIRGLLG